MEVIRFQCPACSVALTVPPSAAGFRGPCPKCSAEIIGPDPERGLPAGLPPSAAATETFAPEPFPDYHPPSPAPAPLPAPIPGPEDTADVPPADEVSEPDHSSEVEPIPSAEDVTTADTDEAKPFGDFVVPAPDPEPEAPVASTSRRPNVVTLLLAFLLCVALAFAGGFAAARKPDAISKPVFSTKEVPPPPPPAEPIPVQVRTWIPEPPPREEAVERKIVGPEATLKAFLDADGWAARSAYVLFPENIRPRMEEHAQSHDDGPIETTDVSLYQVTPQAHVFMVSTPAIPGGFPVAVARDDNSWLVDWENFTEFHDDRFKSFAAGNGGGHGVFHLMIKPAADPSGSPLFESYRLNPPIPDREQTAYVRKDSTTQARIRAIFGQRVGLSEEEFEKLLEGAGLPMVLALSYKTNSQDQSFIEIEEVVSVGWGPGEP